MSEFTIPNGLREKLSELLDPPLSDDEWESFAFLIRQSNGLDSETMRQAVLDFVKEHDILEREYRKNGKSKELQEVLEKAWHWAH